MKARFLILFVLTTYLLNTTLSFSRDLESIRRSGKIYVGMTKDDKVTVNYPLAVEFAKYLNVELIIVEITWEEAFMKNGAIPKAVETDPAIVYNPDVFKKVDIICSTFTVLDWRKKLFDFAETLNSSELLLIDRNNPPITNYSMLAGKTIAFMGNTSFETNLININESLKGGIKLIPTKTTEESKELIGSGKVFGIILDADEALLFNYLSDQRYSISLPVSPMTKTAWAVEKGNDLKKEVEDFFITIESNGVLDGIFNSKFGISYSAYVEKINRIVLYKKHHRDLDEILDEGKLVVAFRDRDFIYQEGGEKQPMHALAEEFANYLGVSLEYVVTPSLNKYWETENGEVARDSAYTPEWFNYFDVACDLFSRLDWRSKKINFVPVYPSDYSVIAKKDKQIKTFEDLRGLKCVTSKGSSYEDILIKNNLSDYYYESANNFLTDVLTGKADYTIMDNAFSELPDYPELESKISLGTVDICWGLRKDQPKLEAELEKFIAQSKNNGLINILLKAMQRKTLQSPESFVQSYYESQQTGQLPYVLFGAEDGLPQEDIFTVFQDKKGYMWFGTNSGAVRYNGREMKSIGTFQGLGDNVVNDIDQDSTGIVYLATSRGIIIYDRDTIIDRLFTNLSFHSVYVDKFNSKWFIGSDGISVLSHDGSKRNLSIEFPALPKTVYCIEEHIKTGDKYIASSEGVYCYSAVSNQISRLTEEDSYSIFIENGENVWVSTKKGLLSGELEDLKAGNFISRSKNLNSVLKTSGIIIKHIINDRNGSVWLVSDSKIIQVLSSDYSVVVYDQNTGLKKNKILSLLIDKENNIWVGFSGGLQRLSTKKGLRAFFPNVINSYVYSIIQASSGKIWISSNDGVYYYDNKLIYFTPDPDSDNQKYVMGHLPNKNILFASSSGLYEVDPNRLAVVRKRAFNQILLSLENIFISSKGEIVLLTGIDGTIYYFTDFNSAPVTLKEKLSSDIFQLIEKNDRILGGNASGLIELKEGHLKPVAQIDCKVWSLYSEENILWLGTECGLEFIINEDYDNIQHLPLGSNIIVKSIYPARNKNYLWLGTNHGFAYFNKKSHDLEFFIDSQDGLSGDEITPSGLFIDNNDLLWIGTYHGLNNFNIRAKSSVSDPPACYLEKVLVNGEIIGILPDQAFSHYQNNFIFETSALSFIDEKSIEFEFYLRGRANGFSSYQKGKENKAYFNNLPSGHYEFIYKAKGKNNIWSYAQKYEFSIRTAWYNTWFFRISFLLVIIIIFWILYKIRIRSIQAQKKKLEQLVKERTQELEEANVEIEAQRDMAASQRDQIIEQKKDITDSIYYAERIQRSLLPPADILITMLPEHFILYKPRNIVSGDFYWISEKAGKVYVTAVDCTGHGVPGALMSMLGISFLNEIVNKSEEPGPDEIINQLRGYIIKALKQEGREGEARDGMDMSFIVYDRQNQAMSFAGANNPIYFIRDNKLQEVKGDKMPVGIHDKMDSYTRHTFDIRKGDTVYIFSDGYADQFGGPHNKKFLYSNFKKLLLSNQEKSMVEQGKILDKTFEEWKGVNDQVDDVVIIGLRF